MSSRSCRILPHLPLAAHALHEFYAAAEADGTALISVVSALAHDARSAFTLWIRHAGMDRECGLPYPPGLVELGLDPARIILVQARDAQAALQAGLEGARCAALGAVLIELHGEARIYDLTASRRLALAARASGTPVLLARTAAMPVPSAAETRWRVCARASQALAANAPGKPAFELTLLRARNSQGDMRYHLEWDRDVRAFNDRYAAASTAISTRDHTQYDPVNTPLPGLVVPVSFNRPDAAEQKPAPQRRAG
jgi:protein ImuA